MSPDTKKYSFTFYRPLYKISQFFSVLPNSSKCYSYLALLFFLSVIIWSLILKVFFGPRILNSIRILDLWINLLASFCTLLSIINQNFIKIDKIRDLFLILTSIDLELQHTYKCERKLSYKGRLTFFIGQIVILVLIFMEVNISLFKMDFNFFIHYVPVYINLYVVVVVILQYNFLVAVIGIRCKILNDKLSELVSNLLVYKKSTTLRSILAQNINPKFFTRNYIRIYDATALVNNIFGLQILLIFALIELFVVKALNIVVLTLLDYVQNSMFKMLILISNLWGSFIFLVSKISVFLIFQNNVLVFWGFDIVDVYKGG
jgi:hypothetical protein